MDKPTLRRTALARRDALSAAWRASASAAIGSRARALPEFVSASDVAAYVAVKSEVETRGLLAQALGVGKRVAVPISDVTAGRLTLARVSSLDALVPGAFGIPEPRAAPAMAPRDVQLVFVPIVGFDEEGHRVGYGRGFFDRLLGEMRATKVGLAFETQRVERIPEEAHDVPLDIIVTEARVRRLN
ncbi:MAG: 5-formyltetrahydrofolate cyclo-ligase [Thermoplasmatota archaeon]